MSPLSSPIGSSARSSSPAARSDNEDIQLTPRSKVRALLAGLDDSDEDEVPARLSTRAQITKSSTLSPTLPQDTLSEDGNSEDDEGAIVAPKGRLAARLQARMGEPVASITSKQDGNVTLHQSHNDNEPTQAQDTTVAQSRPQGSRRSLKRKRALHLEEDESVSESGNVDGTNSLSSFTGAAEQAFEGHGHELQEEVINNVSEHEVSATMNRFAALVEKKRAERLAREAAEEAKKAQKAAAHKKSAKDVEISEVDSDDEDSESGVRLTQKTRPVRRAGKKAIEEMARETQRISRNMQLAHEAKTKKKITKESLLARFRIKQQPSASTIPASSSTVNSSTPNSDCEGQKHTPPTSPERPPYPKSKAPPILIPETSNIQANSDDELPGLGGLLAKPIDKGKSRASELLFEDLHPVIKPFQPIIETGAMPAELPEAPIDSKKKLEQRPIRLFPPKDPVIPAGFELDSDDDLEVVQSKVFRFFENPPAKQRSDAKSLLRLRALARLTSPSRKMSGTDKVSMTSGELASSLRSKARQQAAAERLEKIEVLRSKGIIIQTAEERQKDQMQVEDMLEKARQEVEELTKREKEAAKKEAKAKGEDVEDSSEDEEYQNDEGEVDDDVELSGSEDEDAADDEEESHAAEVDELIDDAASEDSVEDGEDEAKEEDEALIDEDGEIDPADYEAAGDDKDLVPQRNRRRNMKMVFDDEEDEEQKVEGEEVAFTSPGSLPKMPTESPEAVLNPFGPQIGVGEAPMGLTQAFAATMADSQLRDGFSQEDSLLQLRSMPSPDFPNFVPNSIQEQSQAKTLEELDIDLHFTQTQIEYDTLAQNAGTKLTQFSEMPDPTQDAGFEKSSPLQARFAVAPTSTVDTVIVPQELTPTQSKKRGRLMKRQQQNLALFSDEENDADEQLSDIESSADDDEPNQTAFNVMKRAAEKAKRKERSFDKGKSEAKAMFEEQAQESEDEYAGLGGASDDSEGEEDEEIRRMIDEGDVNVNERKVAAYFAEKEREENEAGISKLYKDINSGALRRKRGAGADFDDLDDSDDDHQARQARKRREFARMRKALLDGDSNILKIAEDPKKSAFLRAIEDLDDQEDLGLLDSTPHENDEDIDSQDVVPDSQSENRPPGVFKRRRGDTESELPPAKRAAISRRTHFDPARKPATLADIRDSVSFLVEEPDSMFATEVGPSMFDVSSDVELEMEEELNVEQDMIGKPDGPQRTNPRRTGPRPTNQQFVDRLSLKRQESSKDSQSSGGHMAFMDPRFSSDASAFKPATLLRKATSSFSIFSVQDENGISTNNNAKKAAMEPDVKGRGVGGGSKRSSVNYYARAAERKAALEKQQQGKSKRTGSGVGAVRRQSSGLSNLLGSGNAWE